eukprot:7345885-Pyramimonas_sp.AAC.1
MVCGASEWSLGHEASGGVTVRGGCERLYSGHVHPWLPTVCDRCVPTAQPVEALWTVSISLCVPCVHCVPLTPPSGKTAVR